MKVKLFILFFISSFFFTNAQIKISDLFALESKIFKNKIYFIAQTNDLGQELWVSDGTASNTHLVKDIFPGKESGFSWTSLHLAAEMNDELYFIARDSESNGEIWKTDGTKEGTKKITNFLNGKVTKLTPVGNQLFFLLQTPNNPLQVWKTDGTENGSILVKDDISIWNTPSFEGKVNNTFIFTISPYDSNNVRVWRSDGTKEGTFPITEEIDGNGSGYDENRGGTSLLSQYIEHNQKLYFVSRFNIYETDGTLENTKILSNDLGDIPSEIITFSNVIAIQNKLYFSFFSEDSNRLVIIESDETPSGTKEIYRKYGIKYFSPSNLMDYNGNLMFTTSNELGGTSLVSMNLDNYSINYLKEISENTPPPSIYTPDYLGNKILKINTNLYFTRSIFDENFINSGWLTTSGKTENIPILDNIWFATAFNGDLYYSKNGFWKFDKNLLQTSAIKNSEFNIFPNPVGDELHFNFKNQLDIQSVSIYDTSGRAMITTPYQKQIKVSSLLSGIYILKLKLRDNSEIIKKIIKK